MFNIWSLVNMWPVQGTVIIFELSKFKGEKPVRTVLNISTVMNELIKESPAIDLLMLVFSTSRNS